MKKVFFISFCLIGTICYSVIPTHDLSGCWRLDGNANCYYPTGSTSTVNGNAAASSGGKFGGCYTFDGSGDYILSNVTVPIGGQSRSISAWFKSSSTPLTFNAIAGIGTAAAGVKTFWIALDINGKVYTQTGSGANEIRSASAKDDGNWHHVALTYDGEGSHTFALYVDGILEGSINGIQYASTASAFTIGTIPWDIQWYFTGMIDEVRLFKKPLSAGEVRNLMLNFDPYEY